MAETLSGYSIFRHRGNIQTRLQKLEEQDFDATILSLAGIKRMNMDINYEMLPVMIPAASQGVITVAGHSEKPEINEILKTINHKQTQICVEMEKKFSEYTGRRLYSSNWCFC